MRKPTRLQRIKAWIQSVDLDKKPIQNFVDVHDSGCYYGEYPLSFAASVGACNVCDLLRVYFLLKRQHRDESLIGLYENAASLNAHEGDDTMKTRVDWYYTETRAGRYVEHPAFVREMGSHDYFVNARDSHGNTALHLAVIHKRFETIKWLIENGAKESLGLMNDEGFTPLTLSCRLGLTEVFQALLHHLQTVSWTYGEIKMARLDLEQIDTYRMSDNQLHRTTGWMSAIEIIVAHEVRCPQQQSE